MSDQSGHTAARVTSAKLAALREVLERDGEVTFKNGSLVTWTAAEYPMIGGPEEIEGRIEVERPSAPGAPPRRFTDDEPGLRAAYEWALHGPVPIPQPSGDGSRFGDDSPW